MKSRKQINKKRKTKKNRNCYRRRKLGGTGSNKNDIYFEQTVNLDPTSKYPKYKVYDNKNNKQIGFFIGNVIDNKRSGDGTMYDTNGQILQDDLWIDDVPQNRKIFENGTYYGDIIDEKRHGKGKMIFQDKSEYNGQWKDNGMHGYGTMKYSDGDIYTGNWENNQMNGLGTMKYSDRKKYTGIWKENQMNGYGIMKYSNGKKYTGIWKDNAIIHIMPSNESESPES